MFSFLLQKCTSAGTNSHDSSQQQNRTFHCPLTQPASLKLLFLQLATLERCPDFSHQGFSLASPLSVNPLGLIVPLSPVSWAALHTILLFKVPRDTQAPLENPCSPKPTYITPVLGWVPWSSTGAAVSDTPTLPMCGGFSDTWQHFLCDRFLQLCCHFSLPFVISSSPWTLWEGASPASAPEHHKQLCNHSMPWSACPVTGLEILRATGKWKTSFHILDSATGCMWEEYRVSIILGGLKLDH